MNTSANIVICVLNWRTLLQNILPKYILMLNFMNSVIYTVLQINRHSHMIYWNCSNNTKAELLQVGIFFLIHLFAGEILLLKKLEIEETKTT